MSLIPPRISAIALLAALLATEPVASQAPQQPPIFRAEANLVEVIARVTDAKGQFIPDLTQADFALEEEGRSQTIVAFNRVDLPRAPVMVAGTSRPVLDKPVMSTVATNAKADEARLFVIMMDDILMAPQFTIPARRAARAFIERHVGPNDLVAIFSTGGVGVRTQEFTADKARVLQTIDRFRGLLASRVCRSCQGKVPVGNGLLRLPLASTICSSWMTRPVRVLYGSPTRRGSRFCAKTAPGGRRRSLSCRSCSQPRNESLTRRTQTKT